MIHKVFSILSAFILCAIIHADQSILEVPPHFGKTHFIEGLDTRNVFLQKDTEHVPQQCPIIRALFSPDDDVLSALVHLIEREHAAIDIAAYCFTDYEVAQALGNAVKRGVRIRFITDPSCLKDTHNKCALLAHHGVRVLVYNQHWMRDKSATLANLMHNKFFLFKNNPGAPIVWTGSYNPTRSARKSNQENVLIIEDATLYQTYLKQFEKIIERSVTWNPLPRTSDADAGMYTGKNARQKVWRRGMSN